MQQVLQHTQDQIDLTEKEVGAKTKEKDAGKNKEAHDEDDEAACEDGKQDDSLT